MKVIVAGLSKTGTKSMVKALEKLGYNVYDYLENFDLLYDEWEKIMLTGGTTDDFRKMYKNVDAVTDTPACYFWDEIHKAFPNAKIILTIRDNEDQWYQSMLTQVDATKAIKFKIMYFLSPTYRRYSRYGLQLMWPTIFGIPHVVGLLPRVQLNEMKMKMVYRRHLTDVMQNAPKDKLLVFNVKEGWSPLCQFLDAEVPDIPFPHRNAQSSILNEFAVSPVFKRIEKEMILYAAVWVGLSSLLMCLYAYL